jgi:hypothetical protein
MYQILISMPARELLVGEGDADDSSIPGIDGWHLSVRFDGRVGKLVIQGSRANLLLDGLSIFDAHISGGITRVVDYGDGGRHEFIYRATVDDEPIAIGIALDTDPTSRHDTSWLTRVSVEDSGVVAIPEQERRDWTSSSVASARFFAPPVTTSTNLGPKIALWVGIISIVLGSSLPSEIMFALGVADAIGNLEAFIFGACCITGALVAWKT